MNRADFEQMLAIKRAKRRYSVIANYRVGHDFRSRTIASGCCINDGRALIDTLENRERNRFIRRGHQYSAWLARIFILQLEQP